MPIYIFQGTDDELTLATVTKEYFDTLNAPHKETVLLEKGGHFAVWSTSERFLRELVTRVRPLAVSP